MKTIEWMDVTPVGDGSQHFCCCASDIGLPPGGWPTFIKTGLGNGRDFVKQYRDGEKGFIYQQEGGTMRLMIFND